MSQDRITYLFNRYFEGTATFGEISELKTMFAIEDDEALRWELLVLSVMGVGEEIPEVAVGTSYEEAFGDTEEENRQAGVFTIYRKYWYAAAAILAFVIAGTAYFFMNKQDKQTQSVLAVTEQQDVPPGGDRATLTLADGSVVVLDSAKDGTIAREGMTTINLLGGEITYAKHQNEHQTGKDLAKNTLTTPRGGEFKLVLPDGRHV